MAQATAQVNSHFLSWDAFASHWTDPGPAFLSDQRTIWSRIQLNGNCPAVIIGLPTRFGNGQLQFGAISVVAASEWGLVWSYLKLSVIVWCYMAASEWGLVWSYLKLSVGIGNCLVLLGCERVNKQTKLQSVENQISVDNHFGNKHFLFGI